VPDAGAGRGGDVSQSVAAANRAALIAAAREVFAQNGLAAPLSSVARRAGVGQGTLYRHFPDRASLAVAVFEQNVTDLEALASTGASLDDLLALLTQQAVHSVSFVSMARPADDRLGDVLRRVGVTLQQALDRARERGDVRADLSMTEVLLAIGMVATQVAAAPADERERTADAAWRLLRRGLVGAPPR
jgi:AcrR family transcriptional regulator